MFVTFFDLSSQNDSNLTEGNILFIARDLTSGCVLNYEPYNL
jgi:hypothetical protein